MSFVLFDTASALPSYFSLQMIEGVPSGPPGHWTGEDGDALQFSRKQDALNFQTFFLRHMIHITVKEL